MTGKEFRKLRDRLGINQPELAELLGVHEISISRYETGTRQISEPVAKLLQLLVKLRDLGGVEAPGTTERRRTDHHA